MKKVSAVLISLLLVIMSMPSISSRADGGSIFRAITSDIFEDQYGSEALGWVSPQFSRSESYFDDFTSEDYDFLNDPSNYPFDITSDRVIYAFGGFNAAKGNMQIVALDFSEISGDLVSVFTNVNGITVGVEGSSGSSSVTGYYLNYSPYSHSFIQNSTFTVSGSTGTAAHIVPTFVQDDPNPDPDGKQKVSVVTLNDSYTFYNYSSSYLTYMFYTNCLHYYSSNQFWDSYTTVDSVTASQISNNFGALNLFDSLCTDYLDGGFSSYFDGVGVVTPDRPTNEETNANHMFFNRCNFGFCEPVNVNSFASFGGAYFYVDYDVDNWVRDHIADYQIRFHALASVGSSNYSFTKVYSLDPDNCLTIPFSLFDGWNNPGFSSFVTNRRIDNTFLKAYLYSVPGSQYLNFYNSISSGSYSDTLSNSLQQLLNSGGVGSQGVLTYTSGNFTSVIKQALLDSEFTNGLSYYSNYKFVVSAVLVDQLGNESGLVEREFDIVRGSDTATDNSGLTNQDPFISDEGDDQLPYIPTDNDIVSSTGSGFYNNINFPSEYNVTYRDGVNTFIDWYNNDPSSTGIMNSFWGMMGVFRDNPATDIYEDYWGFLPSGFKTLVLACASLGIIGFAATVLRRRLMS